MIERGANMATRIEWRYALHVARADEGYQATVLGDSAVKGLGSTREMAIFQAEAALCQAVASGEIVTAIAEVPERNQWVEDAGMWKDMPDGEWAVYQQAIDDYRRELAQDAAIV
jgi:hypothetical protein